MSLTEISEFYFFRNFEPEFSKYPKIPKFRNFLPKKKRYEVDSHYDYRHKIYSLHMSYEFNTDSRTFCHGLWRHLARNPSCTAKIWPKYLQTMNFWKIEKFLILPFSVSRSEQGGCEFPISELSSAFSVRKVTVETFSGVFLRPNDFSQHLLDFF